MGGASAPRVKSRVKSCGTRAEHNTPFAHIDHLVEACKSAFLHSPIAKKIRLHGTKTSYLVQDGIAQHEDTAISKACRESKFSMIIFDESTSISVC